MLGWETTMAKLLLIEDDREMAGEIIAELADHGFEVDWAATGIEGLDKARSGNPDALIVDRLLPGMDGVTIVEALRQDQVRTPVLILSALGAVDDRVRGLRAGGDDYLTKPFDLVELIVPREFRLLEYMMRRKDQTLTRAMLLEEVWKYKFVPQTNLVDVHMGRLRHKVDDQHEPPMIHSVRGVGFILRAPA